MKQGFRLLTVVSCAGLFLMGCASQDVMRQGPSFVVTTPVVTLAPGGKVVMYGTGFAPKQELVLLLKDSAGGMSGLSGAVTPAPVPNADGVWAAEWVFTAYVSVISPGTAMLTVADKDYKPLGVAPIVFLPKPKPVAVKPEAAKPEAAKPKPAASK